MREVLSDNLGTVVIISILFPIVVAVIVVLTDAVITLNKVKKTGIK